MENTQDIDRNVRIIKILAKYQVMIQAYSYTIVRDYHLVQDIYQDVSIVLIKSTKPLPQGPGLTPWLREVTRRKSLEALRNQKRPAVTLSNDVLEVLAESFEPKDSTSYLQESMRACVSKLSESFREVVMLRYRDKIACNDIANKVKRSVQSIYSILKRARILLGKCMEQSSTTLAEQRKKNG